MNRIVIVGNGFDLAHGAPTRYSDFYKWWLTKAFDRIKEGCISVDEGLFSVELNPHKSFTPGFFDDVNILSENRNVKKESDYFFGIENNRNVNEWQNSVWIKLIIKDKLFDILSSKSGWTDIEKSYFDLLIKLFKLEHQHYQIETLNKSFELIKSKFCEYIRELKLNSDMDLNSRLSDQVERITTTERIYDDIDLDYKDRVLKRFTNTILEEVIFVNFNYTQILDSYLSRYEFQESPKVCSLPIHGRITDPESIVFGYGDEKNSYHRDIEESNNDLFLKHFKSNYYGGEKHYTKLIDFVESNEFDVIVIGHSLGLSDRVLLNTIFENDNCKAIHMYHTGGDSHFRKRLALSRHFDDKHKLRKRQVVESERLKL